MLEPLLPASLGHAVIDAHTQLAGIWCVIEPFGFLLENDAIDCAGHRDTGLLATGYWLQSNAGAQHAAPLQRMITRGHLTNDIRYRFGKTNAGWMRWIVPTMLVAVGNE